MPRHPTLLSIVMIVLVLCASGILGALALLTWTLR